MAIEENQKAQIYQAFSNCSFQIYISLFEFLGLCVHFSLCVLLYFILSLLLSSILLCEQFIHTYAIHYYYKYELHSLLLFLLCDKPELLNCHGSSLWKLEDHLERETAILQIIQIML